MRIRLLRPLRLHHALPRRTFTTIKTQRLNQFLKISDEVQAAISARKPVVALESAIYTHGFPHPQNLELAQAIEKTVRDNGAVPATICLLNGKAIIGLNKSELEEMTDSAGKKETMKISRRDLAFATGVSFNDPSRSFVGGTTIAGTSVLAHMAGIKVFATGGLGGVHRGVEKTMDVSADLRELGRTNIAVICAGSKAFLDLERTLEYLETEGVYVGTFGVRNSKVPVEYPAFYSRGCGIKSPSVVTDAKEAAAIIYTSHSFGLTSGQLFANPIPKEFEIPNEEIQDIIKASVAAAEGVSSGKDVTPFILNDILKRTLGRSIKANRGLILNNAEMGAKVAVELAKLEGTPHPSTAMPHIPTATSTTTKKAEAVIESKEGNINVAENPEVLVIGGIAVDICCDYTPYSSGTAPALHTSNPSRISESLGGVANNVAYAMHLSGTKTRLVSSVGDDISGRWVLEQIRKRGMDTSGLSISSAYQTARYVAINDAKGGLFTASADMAVIEYMAASTITDAITRSGARWVVIDGNLLPKTITAVLRHCKKRNIKGSPFPASNSLSSITFIFEPTSSTKSTTLFNSPKHLTCYPSTVVFAAAPNTHELDAMYSAAEAAELFSTDLPWWKIIDSLLIESRFHDSLETLSRSSGMDLITSGTLQKAINLVPYIPNLFIKLSEKGCLVVRLLAPGDKMLETRSGRETLVRKARVGEEVGGIYIRHFEAEEVEGEVLSVNGAGDTFLGVLVGGMVKYGDGEIEETVEMAQRAAVLTLGTREAVSERIQELV
ncbi:Indigoidine synthase A like protein-domain-containing protein [Trichophaea hybrida]|nr:Indigoidine synthase A like protein-domain-containing protein [Trichophaea hybrida]